MEKADGLTTGRTSKQELEEKLSQNWDAQFQEFLKTLQTPCSRGGGPQQPEPRTTDPAPSKGLTEPGGLGASQPQSIPTGEAKQGHEGKEKRIRTWDAIRVEMWRSRFRTLAYQELEGPRETCRQLQELCCQWLRPKRHSKEHILDLLALEQFLAVLPPEMQRWVSESNPENCAQAVSLAEEFLKAQQGAKGWETQSSSEDLFVNPPETCKELPGAAKDPCFAEARKCVEGSTNVSGNGWLSKPDEKLTPFLEIAEEEELQERLSETAKENDSPQGGKGDENPSRAESQNGNNHEMETTEPVLSEGPGQALGEALGLQQVKSMKCEAHEDSLSPSPHLLTHETSQAGGKTYECWHCGQNFASSSDLLSHERKHMGEKLYKCAHCGENERIYIGQKPHKCSHCGSKLREGMHNVEKRSKCTVCGDSFESNSGLKIHQRVHRDKKPYKYPACNNNASWRSPLVVHGRILTGEKPYRCSDCGIRFSTNYGLRLHQKIHAGEEKPFECPVCGKRFRYSSEVLSHQSVHGSIQPLLCSDCGRNIGRTDTLQKPYRCSDCEKR
ncbi:uncharacterized protein LOC143834037 [Paroedura picta]|uniref:uncharacterized protein LOC143834037 n=1 Tax=Paroedura picta TaxID=143630 RepID=UPI004055AEE2